MRNHFALLILLALSTGVVFADERPANDYKNSKKKKGDLSYLGFSMGYNGLIQNLSNMNMPSEYGNMSLEGRSINVNFTFCGYTYYFLPKLGVGTALELEVNNFRFENNVSLMKDPENWNTVVDDSYTEKGITLKKSKLTTTYLNIPLTLRFNIGGRDKIYLYGGIVGSWRIGSYTKIKANSEVLKGKHKNHSNYNLRPLRWGYTVGFGYSHIGIYAKYYPQSIFKPGKGPSLQQANIGVALTW